MRQWLPSSLRRTEWSKSSLLFVEPRSLLKRSNSLRLQNNYALRHYHCNTEIMIRSAGTIRELGVRRNIVTGVIPIWCEIHRNKVSEHNTSDSFNPLSRRTEAAILNCIILYLLAKMRFPSTIVCTITVSPYVNPHFIIETLESHTNSLPATGRAALFRFAFALNDITSLSRFTTFAAADDWVPTFGVIFFPTMADDFFVVSFFGAILLIMRKRKE